jgi:hypothetical protein
MFSLGIRHGNRLRLVVTFAALDQTAMGVFCLWVPRMEGWEAVELLYDIPPIVLREE